MSGARIPADVDREDRVLAGLTARQLAVLAATAALAWVVASVARLVVPAPLVVVVCVPVAVGGLVVALGRWDGLSGERFAAAGLRHAATPKRRVFAPEGLPPLPRWLRGAKRRQGVAPLAFLAGAVDPAGIVDLGPDGSMLVCAASAVNFSLRSPGEQAALVAGFGRMLHSLAAPVQFLVRAERADLSGLVERLAAHRHPHPGLAALAADHAAFLGGLASRRDLLAREILVVFREPRRGGDPAGVLSRRVEEAAALLQAASVSLVPLDGPAVAGLLARCADPTGAPPPAGVALPGAVIRTAGAGQ